MKKVLTWLLAAMVFSQGMRAQKNGFTVCGEVKDSLSGTGMAYATLRVVPENGEKALIIGTADTNGRFSIQIPRAGTFRLQCVTPGMAPVERMIELNRPTTVNVGTLLMQEYSSTLGTATVTAGRPIVKAEIDKLSYNMGDDPEAETNSLLDMLRKVPMVTVDGEDNIKVNGNGSFKVYVNGKLNTMMSGNPSLILKNYPASAVKKVEVITDPGAKYDAEGVAGILNIVTESNTRTGGYTLTPHINPSNRGIFGSLFGMAQIGKLTLSGNYGASRTSRPGSETYSEREVFSDATNHLLRSAGESDGHANFQFGNLEASYELGQHDLISLTAGLFAYKGTQTGQTLHAMHGVDGKKVYGYKQLSETRTNHRNFNVSTDYQHTFKKEGQAITISYRYNSSPNYNRSTQLYTEAQDVPYRMDDLYSNPENYSYEHTAQADFTTPIGRLHTLSLGMKYIYRINKSDNEEYAREACTDAPFELSEAQSLRYRHRGDITAGYMEYTLKLKKFTTRAGLRYEHSDVRVSYPDGSRSSFDSHFEDFVPSLSFGYSLSESKMLKMGYNLRIGRPDISYLSPYVSRPTPEAQSYGNPNLDSEKGHNFNLGFSSFTPKLSINATLTYQLQTNGLTAYTFLDEEGVQTTTYGNLRHTKEWTLNTYLNWNILPGTALNLNADGSYADYKAKHYHGDTNAHNHGFSADLWGGLRQDLPWHLKLNVHGGGSLPSFSLQGKEAGFYFYGISLSRSFLEEDRLTVNLSAGNFIHPKHSFRNTTITDDFRLESISRHDFLRFGLGIRYRLGSLKAIVKKAARTIENTDIKQQSGGGNDSMQGSM